MVFLFVSLILQTRIVSNQPYDESLEVPDAEEVASLYSPSPRQPGALPGGLLGNAIKDKLQFW